MIFRILIGFATLLIACSFPQKDSKSGVQSGGDSQHQVRVHPGLKIENSPNRGLNYTDPQGIMYSYRYIPTTITNDTKIPVCIQIDLSKEYDYPNEYGDQKFRVFLLPEEVMSDKVTWDSSTYEIDDNELRNFFDRDLNPPYVLNDTLKPGDKLELSLGALYPRPTLCGVVPNVLFLEKEIGIYQECRRLENEDHSLSTPLSLGLKVNFCGDNCFVIPCGNISYHAY